MTEASRAAPVRWGLLCLLLVLLGLVVIGRLAMRAWLDRPAPTRLPEIGATTAEARPFCLVILDGLREAAAWAEDDPSMPWLQAFAARGASGVAWAGDPTLTAPCVRALITGRAPDLVTGLSNFDADPVSGSLFEYLHGRGAHTATAGDASVFQFCRPYFLPEDALAIPDQGPTDVTSDGRAVEFLLARIEAGADAVSLHLTRPDHTGHMSGATGPEYLAACTLVDGQTKTVVEAFLARHPDALVLVAADHGVSPTGTHGGGENSARRAPFALVGPGVARISGIEISQFALAPTIAGLLGLPLPPLADAPPAPQLMDLPEERVLHVMDAYVQARLAVARSLGAASVDPIERKRAEVTVRRMVGERGEPYQLLAEELNALLNPSSTGHAIATLLLAALWLATLVHLVSVGYTSIAGGRVAVLACVVGLIPALGGAAPLVAGGALLAACGIVLGVAAPGRPRGAIFTWACLAAVPVLTAAGHALTSAWEATEDPSGASRRLLWMLGALVLVVGLTFRPRRLWRRLAERAREAPGLVAAFGGVALGFTLTLRPFVNPFVDIRIVFAAIGIGVVAGLVVTPRARARPAAERIALALLGLVLFVAPRVADLRLEASWLEVVARRDTAWLLAGALLVPLLPLAMRPRGLTRSDLPGLLLAMLALVGGFGVRLAESPGAWMSRGSNLLGLAALVVTCFRGTPDGKLLVRLLAAAALGRRLTALDGEFVPYMLFVLGAALAARLPAPRTRVGLAWLGVGLLAIRTATHHAMGGVEDFGTVDVAAGFVGLEVAAGEVAADGGGVSLPIIEAGLQLALRFALPWVVLLSVAARVLSSSSRLRTLTGDLALTFAARGAAIAMALWPWWRSAWWVGQARAVYALGAADLLLLFTAAALVGAFRRDSPPASAPPTAISDPI